MEQSDEEDVQEGEEGQANAETDVEPEENIMQDYY